jgi:hypothetical protein
VVSLILATIVANATHVYRDVVDLFDSRLSSSTVVDGRTLFLRNERCDVDEIRCTFDRVFDVRTTQQEVYEHSAKPLVRELLLGYNWYKHLPVG